MNRTTLGLATAGFVIVGFALWVVGMPKPAETTLSAGLTAQLRADALADSEQDALDPAAHVPIAAIPEGAVVADDWLLSTAASTGIPNRALQAYANAAIAQASVDAACGLGWNLLAAIGSQESQHGTYGGGSIGDDGEQVGDLLGPVLDGGDYDAVKDTDGGALDGDRTWDRAVGPMQFLPATWALNATDGNGDGRTDPNNIDDAARTAATYLCGSGRDLATPEGWEAAVAGYNPNADYLTAVTDQAIHYGSAVG